MGVEVVIDVFRQGIYLAIIIVAAIIAPGLLAGLLIAMFQAATQINEMSLSFVPKLIITLMTIVFLSPWIAKTMLTFVENLLIHIPQMIT